MLRFRPNVVPAGVSSSWCDDSWRTLAFGAPAAGGLGAVLKYVKPCEQVG